MTTAWDELWPRLRHGDVYPFPLATETNYTSDGWEVSVIAVAEVHNSGYSATTIWSYREPYQATEDAEIDMSPAEANRVTSAAVHAFALRLRDLLAS